MKHEEEHGDSGSHGVELSVLCPGGLTAVLDKAAAKANTRKKEKKKTLKLLIRSGKNDLRIVSAAQP